MQGKGLKSIQSYHMSAGVKKTSDSKDFELKNAEIALPNINHEKQK